MNYSGFFVLNADVGRKGIQTRFKVADNPVDRKWEASLTAPEAGLRQPLPPPARLRHDGGAFRTKLGRLRRRHAPLNAGTESPGRAATDVVHLDGSGKSRIRFRNRTGRPPKSRKKHRCENPRSKSCAKYATGEFSAPAVLPASGPRMHFAMWKMKI